VGREQHVLSNQSRRGAVYIGGGALLVAWLAAANTTRRPDPPAPAPSEHPRADEPDWALLQNEGTMLRERLAHAPSPSVTPRNPFSFASAPAVPSAPSRRIAAASVDVAPVAPPPLPLILMGIAEQPSASGAQRTAILGGSGDEIYMVTVGQTIAARYTVTAVGVDAIELKDLSTGGLRRLALR